MLVPNPLNHQSKNTSPGKTGKKKKKKMRIIVTRQADRSKVSTVSKMYVIVYRKVYVST